MNQSGLFARLSSKLMFSLTVISCSTTPKMSSSKHRKPMIRTKTIVTKTIPSKTNTTSPENEDAPPKANSKTISLDDLFRRLLTPNYQMSTQDIEELSLIGPPKSVLSLKTAILTVGYTRVFISENEEISSPDRPSLYSFLRSKNIDLQRSYFSNPYLQTSQAFNILYNALSHSKEPNHIQSDLLTYAKRNLTHWQELQKTSHEDTSDTATHLNIGTDLDPSQYHAGDLLLGDLILLQAQKLAEKGRYKSAIGRATKVPNSDPYFPAAQEKVKYFSNQAVQELRQKAATAFQNSLPVSDKEVRMTYLEEAKKYLEKALHEFPKADHLTTVRENLAVITRDLTNIDQESTR